jgi:hypothetical protein
MKRFFYRRAVAATLAAALAPATLAGCGGPPPGPTAPAAPSPDAAPPVDATRARCAAPAPTTDAAGAAPRVLVEAMFLNVRAERLANARSKGFDELEAEHRGAFILASHVLAPDGGLAVVEGGARPAAGGAATAGASAPLAPLPRAGGGGDDDAFWAALSGTRFGVTPHVTAPDRVRLELAVELKGVQAPFRAIVLGASGQTLALDTGAGAPGSRLLMLVRADVVRNDGDLCRLVEQRARARDATSAKASPAATAGP